MSVLVAVNPVVAGVAGYLVLDQRLGGPQIAGMVCIVAAATGAVLAGGRHSTLPADRAWSPEVRAVAGE